MNFPLVLSPSVNESSQAVTAGVIGDVINSNDVNIYDN